MRCSLKEIRLVHGVATVHSKLAKDEMSVARLKMAAGAEVDLVVDPGARMRWAIAIKRRLAQKASTAPGDAADPDKAALN